MPMSGETEQMLRKGIARDRLAKAIRAYYAGDQKSPDWMDDEAYEELVAQSGLSSEELERLKRDSVVVMDKIPHVHPMGTLPKVHDLSEIPQRSGERLWQLKYDGCSLEAHVDSEGNVDYACTRGDQLNGDNRTALWMALSASLRVPDLHDYRGSSVRGELVVSDSDWRSLDGMYANQRNAAAGIANRDDTTLARLLTFIPYDVVDDATGDTSIYLGDMCAPTFDTFEQAEAAFRSADVPLDGVVCKDSIDGVQSNALAYKFSDRTVTTTLRNVVWQRGRTGKLTPVAEFAPVFIDAEITRASLGSYRRFMELNLHYGDTIEVRRANQVIPYVESNLGGGTTPVRPPSVWCGTETKVDGAHLFAAADDAWNERLVRQVDDMCGKGVGRAFISDMVEGYGVSTFRELYDAAMDESFSLRGYRERRTASMRVALSEAGSCDLATFLSALCIQGISDKIAGRLVDKAIAVGDATNTDAASVFMTMQAPYEFAYAVHGVGDAVARSFADSIGLVREQLSDFRAIFGHLPGATRTRSSSDALRVVVTGRFDGFTRSDVARELEANGFTMADRITPGVHVLLAGEGGGATKRSAAKALGIRVIECGGDLNAGLNAIKTIDR